MFILTNFLLISEMNEIVGLEKFSTINYTFTELNCTNCLGKNGKRLYVCHKKLNFSATGDSWRLLVSCEYTFGRWHALEFLQFTVVI